MTCHEDYCPALCQDTCIGSGEYDTQGHPDHDCSCQGPALLKELLDAAIHAIYIGNVDADIRLDKALEPFRPLPKLEYNPNACFFLNKIRDTKPVRNRTLQTPVKGISLKKKT